MRTMQDCRQITPLEIGGQLQQNAQTLHQLVWRRIVIEFTVTLLPRPSCVCVHPHSMTIIESLYQQLLQKGGRASALISSDLLARPLP